MNQLLKQLTLFTVLILCTLSVFASKSRDSSGPYIDLWVTAAAGSTNIVSPPDGFGLNTNPRAGFAAGFGAVFHANRRWGLGTGLQFERKGTWYHEAHEEDPMFGFKSTTADLLLNYISIPVYGMIQGGKKIKYSVSIGIAASYLVQANDYVIVSTSKVEDFAHFDRIITSDFEDWDISVMSRMDISFPIGSRNRISIGPRFMIGVKDIVHHYFNAHPESRTESIMAQINWFYTI